MRKTAVSLLIVTLCLLLCSCDLVKSPDYFEFGDDMVPSITKVVGERTVKTCSTSKSYFKYVYKDVEDAPADIKQYVEYLIKTEKFTTSDLLTYPASGSFKLTKASTEKDEDGNVYTLSVKIKYNDGEYTIESEREKNLK